MKWTGSEGESLVLFVFILNRQYLSDDANVPSLISLPYLKACSMEDPVYQATRKMLLSPDNPWYFSGTLSIVLNCGLNKV